VPIFKEDTLYARVQPVRFRLSLIPALLIALFLLSTLVARAATVNVTMKGFAFNPTTPTVNVGDTVTWTNQDTAPHNATADDGTFKTADFTQGQSASVTTTKSGTFSYTCTIHPRRKAAEEGDYRRAGGGRAGPPECRWRHGEAG